MEDSSRLSEEFLTLKKGRMTPKNIQCLWCSLKALKTSCDFRRTLEKSLNALIILKANKLEALLKNLGSPLKKKENKITACFNTNRIISTSSQQNPSDISRKNLQEYGKEPLLAVKNSWRSNSVFPKELKNLTILLLIVM